MLTKPRATVDDLYHVPEDGKAELVNGELMLTSPTGAGHGRVAGRVYVALSDFEEQHGGGLAFGDNIGFLVDLPNRQSFSPDAAWYTGPVPNALAFLPMAPASAVEVRSKGDYGPKAEAGIADKIRDYFAAGTEVVWDVDPLGAEVVTKHVRSEPDNPVVFRRGEMAEAEAAVPGWRMPVDKLLKP